MFRPFYDYMESQMSDTPMSCSRQALKGLILAQWKRISPGELEATQFMKSRIAQLIEDRYSVSSVLAENYLSNVERMLPLA